MEEGILPDLITVASRFLRASDASFDLLGHATRERKGAVYENNDRNRARSREHRAGQQEPFQLLQNAAGIFYALAYLAMFALPLIGRQKEIARPALWLQAAAISGFAMTAMNLVLALFPIIDVPRPLVFTAKVGGFVLGCQLAGAGLFYSYRRKSKTPKIES